MHRLLVVSLLVLVLRPSAGAELPYPPSEWIAQGERQAAAGRFEDAMASYRQALALDPNSSGAHLKLAGLLLVRHDYATAVEHYQQAIGLDPKDSRAFIGLGLAYLHQAQYGQAREALLEAKRLAPAKARDIAAVLDLIAARMGEKANDGRP